MELPLFIQYKINDKYGERIYTDIQLDESKFLDLFGDRVETSTTTFYEPPLRWYYVEIGDIILWLQQEWPCEKDKDWGKIDYNKDFRIEPK